MDDTSKARKPRALDLVDDSSPPGDAERHAGDAAEGGRHVNDRFFAEAEREFNEGLINQPLWVRVLAKAGGDKEQAKPAYLRARATELRLGNRDRHSSLPSYAAAALPAAQLVSISAGSPGAAATGAGVMPARAQRRLPPVAYIAIACAVIGLIIVGLVLGGHRASDDAPPPATATANPRNAPPPRSAYAGVEKAKEEAPTDFAAKIAELTTAANWNVLVLYASEWTRKEPTNATAWRELGAGYLKLHQLNEAFDASKKAVELSPKDPAAWRNLAQVHVASHEPSDAVRAFELAAQLDERDSRSLVQAAMLNVELDRLPQAKADFERVLAIDANDVDGLCGSVAVAQKQGRSKDVEPFVRQLKTLDARCADAGGNASLLTRRPAPPSASAVRAR